MKTVRKLKIIPIYVETMPDYKDFKDAHVYISEKYKVSIHKCLCGCGEKTVLPINSIINGKDHGWKLIKKENGKISFTPSVGNFQLTCKSHYIITNNIANFV